MHVHMYIQNFIIKVNDVVCSVDGTEVNVNSISSFSDTEAIAKVN